MMAFYRTFRKLRVSRLFRFTPIVAHRRLPVLGTLAVSAILFASTPHAFGQTILTGVDSGWYDNTGAHTSTKKNYSAGSNGSPINTNDYFVFDLTGIGFPIGGASISIANPSLGFAGSATETYSLFDVSTPISTLEATNTGATSIYNDLGSGVSYGSVIVSSAANGTNVVFSFNAAGISALNAARGGLFAVGGSLITDPRNGTDHYIFGFSGSSLPQLTLTPTVTSSTPEPGSIALMGMGGLSLVCLARRRRSSL